MKNPLHQVKFLSMAVIACGAIALGMTESKPAYAGSCGVPQTVVCGSSSICSNEQVECIEACDNANGGRCPAGTPDGCQSQTAGPCAGEYGLLCLCQT
jgi:hypothetical protein